MGRIVWLTLWLGGCAASLSAEGMEAGFGPGLSAAHLTMVSSDFRVDVVTISSVLDYCGKQRDYVKAYDEYLERAKDADEDHYCADMEAMTRALAAAGEALAPAGSKSAELSVLGEFETGEHPFGAGVSGRVSYVIESPYAGLMDDYDASGSAQDGCGRGTTDEAESENWYIDDGVLQLDTAEAEGAVVGTVDAHMQDVEGHANGAFTGTFSAVWCDVDLSGLIAQD